MPKKKTEPVPAAEVTDTPNKLPVQVSEEPVKNSAKPADPKTETDTKNAKVPPAEAAVPAKSAVASNGKNILIVEDERPLAHALELKFTHEGFQTKTCLDGSEGLKEAMTGAYHVILLDLIMPQLDGFAFMEQMKAKGVSTPVIVLSNLGQDEDKQKAKDLGAIDYFVKSNTPITDIVKRVRSAL